MAESQNNQDQILGLDASGLEEEINRVVAPSLDKLNQKAEEMIDVLETAGGALKKTVLRFTEVDEAGNKYRVTLKNLKDGWTQSVRLLSLSNEAKHREAEEFKQAEAAAAKYLKTYQGVILAQMKQRGAMVDAQVAREAEIAQQQREDEEIRRKNRLLLDQRALYNQLKQAAKDRAIAEKEARRAAEQARAEAEANRRRISANYVGGQLINSIPAGLDPSRTAQISTAIGQITSAIAKGQITAQDALKTISQVERGEAAAFEGAAARVANATRRIKGMLALKVAEAKPEDRATAQVEKFAYAMRYAGDTTQHETQRINLSWRTMGRLFAIQAFHTAIRTLFDALRDTVQTTEQFEIRISEIRSISQQAGVSTERWKQQVRGLSDEFGAPVLEIAEGIYQGLSNQIINGGNAANFMRDALRFSKATVSSTSDSVNLLSTALNAYHMQADQATYVSQVLFETITQGRVRASEMANTFGRLASLASPLGVRLDELGVSVATLTRQGIKYDEVQTLMANVMIRLLKPSQDMQKIFAQWGVSSGQAAIATFGFFGVLQRLAQVSEGNLPEIADEFKNIRAIVGDVALSNSLNQLNQGLVDMRRNMGANFAGAVKETLGTPAQELIRQGQQLKNYFAVDFGEPVIQQVASLSKSLGGLTNITKTLLEAVIALAGGYTAIRLANIAATRQSALRTTILAAETRAQALNTYQEALFTYAVKESKLASEAEAAAEVTLAAAHQANADAAVTAAIAQGKATTATVLASDAWEGLLGIITNPAFLFGAAIAGVTYLGFKMYESAHAGEKAYAEAFAESTRQAENFTHAVEDSLAEQERAFQDHLDFQYRIFNQFAAGIGQKFEEITDFNKQTLRESVEATRVATGNMLTAYQDMIRKVEDEYRKALDEQRRILEDRDRMEQDFADKQFRRAMQVAQAKDEAGVPGKTGKLFDENQLTLIQNRIAELRQLNAQLEAQSRAAATAAFGLNPSDPRRAEAFKGIDNNNTRVKKNLEEIEKLQGDLLTRRLAIEAEAKRTRDQLAEAETRQKAHQAENQQRIAEDASKKQLETENRQYRDSAAQYKRHTNQKLEIAREGHREQADAFKDAESSARDERERIQRQAQADEDAKRVNDLKARLKAQENALKALPTPQGFDQIAIATQHEITAELQKQADLQKKIADEAKRELDTRKAALEPLKIALENIEKFKAENVKVTTQDELDKRIAAFHSLVDAALKAGLTDQSLINKFVEEETAIRKAGQVDVAKHQFELDQQKLENTKKQVQEEFEARKKALEKYSADTAGLYPRAQAIVGMPGKASESPVGGMAELHENEYIEPLQHQLDALKSAESDLILHQQTFDTTLITRFNKQIDALEQRYYGFVPKNEGAGLMAGDRVTRKDYDAYGNVTRTHTFVTEMQDLRAFIQEFAARIKQEQSMVSQNQKDQATSETQRQKITDQVENLSKQYGFQIDAVNGSNQSFKELTVTLDSVITDFGRLKGVIDKLSPPPTTQPAYKAAGGMLWAPRGTDTVPAMLTPGEYVMTASATRRFYSTLTEMNRFADGGYVGDFTPTFRPSTPNIDFGEATGGTTFNFGDFHYHGPASGDSKENARAIWGELQNMIRRGEIGMRSNRA